MEFQFDLSSFLIGLIAGSVIVSALKLKALKELRLKLEAIGVDLGIEGFVETKTQPSGQSIGPITGDNNKISQIGKINKTSNLYKTMQAAATDAATKNDQKHEEKFLQLVTRFSHYTQNEMLKDTLSRLQRSGDSWPEKYCTTYMADGQFRSDLAAELDRLSASGWRVKLVRPIDSLSQGLLFEITCVRPFSRDD